MIRLLIALILATLGGTFILHWLKNFLLKEKVRFSLDWDGLLERLCVSYIIIAAPDLWLFVPVVIALKVIFRLVILGFFPSISSSTEPGNVSQKVLLKSELAFDLFVSPTFAILIGVIFK
ncbi:MAG: hypothetical protein ABID35_04660 [Candidatus Margulisiibacteriota bacterium]